MSRDIATGRSYAVEHRLRFIDFLFHQYGQVNRSAITDYFGVSTPQASNDLGDYLELAPANATYDARAKAYIRTPEFKRVWP